MVRNLKYVKESIENYFQNHMFINTVKFGDTDNLNTYDDLNYPLMNFEYLDSQFKMGTKNKARFQFAIMDLSDDLNEFDVIDSMNEIANDYLKFLENDVEITIDDNVSLQPFSDEFGDRCSGVTFTISFYIHRNNCDDILPLK